MTTHLKYLTSFFFPMVVVCFLYTGPHHALVALLWTIPLWSMVIIDWLSPKIDSNRSKQIVVGGYYNVILYILTLMQCLIIGLLVHYASQLQWDSVQQISSSIVNLIVMRILVGTSSGSSAIIVAHELIHRPQKHMRLMGRMLLVTVCYDHFVIAHMREHHLSVATPEDKTTARLDESFNDYWKRVTVGHFKYAWNSELNRLNLSGVPVYHYKMLANSVMQGLIVEIMLVFLILFTFGWAATVIFLYQALSGVRLLETINYYQHWGLEQGKKEGVLAWVNRSSFTEYALVGLSNHIAHHQNSRTEFYESDYSENGPVMPYGYFVTNLWVKLNNKSYRQVSSEILRKYRVAL